MYTDEHDEDENAGHSEGEEGDGRAEVTDEEAAEHVSRARAQPPVHAVHDALDGTQRVRRHGHGRVCRHRHPHRRERDTCRVRADKNVIPAKVRQTHDKYQSGGGNTTIHEEVRGHKIRIITSIN